MKNLLLISLIMPVSLLAMQQAPLTPAEVAKKVVDFQRKDASEEEKKRMIAQMTEHFKSMPPAAFAFQAQYWTTNAHDPNASEKAQAKQREDYVIQSLQSKNVQAAPEDIKMGIIITDHLDLLKKLRSQIIDVSAKDRNTNNNNNAE